MLVLSLLVPLAFGYILIRGILPFQRPNSAYIFLKICTALGFGFGITSCLYFLVLLFIGSSTSAIILSESAIFSILLLSAYCKKNEKQNICAEPGENLSVHSGYEKMLLPAFYFVLLCTFATSVLIAIRLPDGGWDAYSIWNLHARFIFRAGERWADVFSNLLSPSAHPDYPLLVPLTVARIWRYLGQETKIVPVMISILFTFATAGLLYSALTILKNNSQGCLAGLLLFINMSFIILGTYQYADVPIGFFFLSSIVFIFVQERFSKNYGLSSVAGAMAGFAGWTKNEGLLFFVSLFMALFFVSVLSRDRRTHLKKLLYFSLGSLPVLAIILYFKVNLAPPSDLLQGHGLVQAIDKLGQVSRYVLILKAFFAVTISVFPEVILLLVYLLLMGLRIDDRDRRNFAILVLVMFFQLCGYLMVYVVTPYDLSWHLGSSLARLLLQLWPSLLFAYFMIVRTPEESFMSGQIEINSKFHSKGQQDIA